MYKIQNVNIDGFWHRCNAMCDFNTNVNIIIGKNGTGKTTFMNILHAILVVDLDGINNNDFDAIEIHLLSNGKKRTVKAKKIDNDKYLFSMVEYQISQKKYNVRVISSDDIRVSMNYRRHAQEKSEEVRRALEDIVSVSSLSVYRLRNDDEYEVRDRHGSRVISPVDYRLSKVLRGLTRYQLSLSQDAREISTKLQKDVLASILYEEEDENQSRYTLDFEKDKERSNLISAYAQLNAIDKDVRKKITFHVNAIDSAIKEIKSTFDNEEESSAKPPGNAFKSLEALRKSRNIIQMSLSAEKQTKSVFSQIDLFLETIKSFISNKDFKFESGDLRISNKQGLIPHDRLSSGEKQLLILLTEALLQNQKTHIFLADEPELSLHIEWQRQVIPAIRKLNPQAQIIVATHSPEVASNYSNSLIDMEEIING
jgi:predicted ATPase